MFHQFEVDGKKQKKMVKICFENDTLPQTSGKKKIDKVAIDSTKIIGSLDGPRSQRKVL